MCLWFSFSSEFVIIYACSLDFQGKDVSEDWKCIKMDMVSWSCRREIVYLNRNITSNIPFSFKMWNWNNWHFTLKCATTWTATWQIQSKLSSWHKTLQEYLQKIMLINSLSNPQEFTESIILIFFFWYILRKYLMVVPRMANAEICQVEFPARGVLAAGVLSSPSARG